MTIKRQLTECRTFIGFFLYRW